MLLFNLTAKPKHEARRTSQQGKEPGRNIKRPIAEQPLRSDSSRRLFGERAESYAIKLVETKTRLHFMQRGSMLCYEYGGKGVWQWD
jgi:hypothetical protein